MRPQTHGNISTSLAVVLLGLGATLPFVLDMHCPPAPSIEMVVSVPLHAMEWQNPLKIKASDYAIGFDREIYSGLLQLLVPMHVKLL